MQDLIDVADKNNYTLYGEPAQLEKEGMTVEQLTDLYAKYGFKLSDETGKVIVREPNAKPVQKEQLQKAIEAKTTTNPTSPPIVVPKAPPATSPNAADNPTPNAPSTTAAIYANGLAATSDTALKKSNASSLSVNM